MIVMFRRSYVFMTNTSPPSPSNIGARVYWFRYYLTDADMSDDDIATSLFEIPDDTYDLGGDSRWHQVVTGYLEGRTDIKILDGELAGTTRTLQLKQNPNSLVNVSAPIQLCMLLRHHDIDGGGRLPGGARICGLSGHNIVGFAWRGEVNQVSADIVSWLTHLADPLTIPAVGGGTLSFRPCHWYRKYESATEIGHYSLAPRLYHENRRAFGQYTNEDPPEVRAPGDWMGHE